MGEISRARLLHVGGGMLGIAAFFLPWVALGSVATRIALTSVDMVAIAIQSFFGEPLAGVAPDTFLLGLGVVAVGLLFLLVASGITIVTPYGGPLMFIASALSSVGLTVMSLGTAPFSPPIAFSPDYGAFLAFSAATLATVGLLLHRVESEGPPESSAPLPEPLGEDG